MRERGDSDQTSVSVCVRTLDRMIGELADRYGAASVVAALIEVVGCSLCVRDSVKSGTSIRALIERIGVDKGA